MVCKAVFALIVLLAIYKPMMLTLIANVNRSAKLQAAEELPQDMQVTFFFLCKCDLLETNVKEGTHLSYCT